jgi:hypothetical protein
MKGYIKNITGRPLYALKRHILPGKNIDIATLYIEYGEKHGIEKGQPFVDWLRNVKLPSEQMWEIQYDGMDEPKLDEENKVTVVAQITQVEDGADTSVKLSNLEKVESGTPFIKKEWEIAEIVDLTVKKAREEIPKIRNKRLLSHALNVATQTPNKETICRILEKRIDELKISTR